MRLHSFILASALLLGSFASVYAVDDNPDFAAAEFTMATRIEQVVKQIAGVPKAWVWVKIDPDIERWQAFVKSLIASRANPKAGGKTIPRPSDILPGVTADELASMIRGKEQAASNTASRPTTRSRNPDLETAMKMAGWFKRVSVRVAIPDTVAPARLKELKVKLPVLIGLNIKTGDTLIVETVPADPLTPAVPEAAPRPWPARIMDWFSQITPGLAALWFCLLAAIFFFFGPIRAFLRDAAAALQVIRVQAQTSGTSQSHVKQDEDRREESVLKGGHGTGEAGAANGKDPAAARMAEEKANVTKELFAFVTDEIMPNILQICQEEAPEHIAMLVSYVKPVLAGRILSSLPVAKRQDVLQHFAKESRFNPENVTAFARSLEKTIYFVSGGPERLLELLEELDPETKNAVLLELDRLFPETARLVRAKLITYTDLFRIERKDLQKLLWEAYRQKISLPLLIVSVSPKGQEYLIKQLPESIAAIVREETKTADTKSFERIEQEGKRLLHLARELEKTGDIAALRQKSATGRAA
jgi:flagellar motor switch protein FliG